MHTSPFDVIRQFEEDLCRYTGAKYAVVVSSCTAALHLALEYHKVYGQEITIPHKTYVGVAQSVINAGGLVKFDEREWLGTYQLLPYPIWDCARLFTSGMYKGNEGTFSCVSFHFAKTLALGAGGAILHDDPDADEWFRRARFDGRREGVKATEDDFQRGWHYIMNPKDAADALVRLSFLPKHNEPLPSDDYADLSRVEIFKS